MSLTLLHHPFSRASGTVWALEEVGAPYELRFVDILKGEQKKLEFLAQNPMGKIPVLLDGDTVVTEAAAIALYLADRYAYGKLAPKVDDPNRGAYFRWSTFPAAVVEPGATAKMNNWTFKDGQVGWGTFDAVLATLEKAVSKGDFLLGSTFSMADVIFGSTLRYMLQFKMLEAKPAFSAYVERINARPALKRADEVNARIATERGLK